MNMKKTISYLVLGALVFVNLNTANATTIPGRNNSQSPYPIRGTFLNFYRDFNQEEWNREFEYMQSVDIDTVVIYASGRLKKVGSSYEFDCQSAHYQSQQFGCFGAQNRLEKVFNSADQTGIKVYVGLLQTANPDWATGEEFDADFNSDFANDLVKNPLPYYNYRTAQELLSLYGNRQSFAGWFFPQEIWLNWAKYYDDRPTTNRPYYYGTKLLEKTTENIKSLNSSKAMVVAPVFKESGTASPPITPAELENTTKNFILRTKVDLFAPQDGIGALNGAPQISTLGSYFEAMKNGMNQAKSENSQLDTQLWSTVELFDFDSSLPAEKYHPTNISRLSQQVSAVNDKVTGMLSWIFGDQMSPIATFYPVEAEKLFNDYKNYYNPPSEPAVESVVSYTLSRNPSYYYSDSGYELINGQGGGHGTNYGDYLGFDTPTSETVTVFADLGTVKNISSTEVLYHTDLYSWIMHPDEIMVETSVDGNYYSYFGSLSEFNENQYGFNIDWATVYGAPTNARYVKIHFTHRAWLFLAEVQIQ